MNDNPYASPKSISVATRLSGVRSRIGWFVVPAFIGAFLGANVFAGTFGTSPSDPFGNSRPSGIGGLVGLFVGAVLHWLTRPRQKVDAVIGHRLDRSITLTPHSTNSMPPNSDRQVGSHQKGLDSAVSGGNEAQAE
ncbi:MAG: hypothetical protein U0905_09170 [Pirellulales bacterium]